MLASLVQVFGGCCTNVFVLDKLMAKHDTIPSTDSSKSLASLITFSQFLFVSMASYTHNTDFKNGQWSRLYLKKSNVPMRKWLALVSMYFAISLMSNWTFSCNISVPMYIVFRLSGTVITMLVGWLFGGKSYNTSQVVSCCVITIGVLINSLPADFSSEKSLSFEIEPKFLLGITLLMMSTLLLAFMGLYSELIHSKYGNQWKESLFYSHFLALPLFLVVFPQIKSEFIQVWSIDNVSRDASQYLVPFGIVVSDQFISLLFNVVSQYICIRGVSLLVGSNSALTVTVILLIRKIISLFISIACFGHELTRNGMIGGSMVLLGAVVYSLAGQKNKKKPLEKGKKDI